MSKLNTRSKIYWIVAITLSTGAIFLSDSEWKSTIELHTLMEVMATIFSLFVGGLALLKYYSRGGTDFLVFGAGFIGVSLLDGYHAMVSSIWFKAYLPSDLPSLIPWSWLASRFVISLLFLILYIIYKRESEKKQINKLTPKLVFSVVATITLGSFAFFAFIPLPSGYFEANIILRPEEFIPASILAIALIGHLKLGYWRHNSFSHWMILCIIINLIAQLVIMPYSSSLFDAQFDLAHLFKKLSYISVLIGLAISVFNAFRDGDQQSKYIKKAHLTLEASEIRNKAMMNTLNDGLVLINDKGIIENINISACNLFGYSKLELLGKNIKMLMPSSHKKKHDMYLSEYLETGNANIINQGGKRLTGLKKNNSTFPLDLMISEMTVNDKIKFTGIIRDDTERLKNENELIKAKNEAQIGAETKSKFLASMSHEIRTPMNGVLGMVELLQDTQLNPQQMDILKTIADSGNALLDIINDILEYSKIEAGKIELEYITFNLERTIYDVTRLLLIKAEEKNLELIFYYHTDCPDFVTGDAGRIRQVLLNLVGNAIKFTHEGQIIIEVKTIKSNNNNYNLRFEIIDSGIGINEEAKNKLFDSFSQADNSTSRKYGGSGLGLSISKQLIQLMEGHINVDSEVGKGSVFWFELHLQPAVSPKAIKQSELDDIKILIIDDNALNVKILKAQLEKLNMRVVKVSNPDNILPIMEQANNENDNFQLVIINNIIANISGESIGIKIKNIQALNNIPLILLASYAKSGDANKYKEIGFSSYLTKPILSDLLYKTLSRVLGLKNNDNSVFLTRHSVLEDEIEHNKHDIKFEGYILLVEDIIINQKVALGLMSNFGLRIDVANNGQEALDMFNKNSYDLILMDCQMPVMDGYEATKKIREINETITIIALTANALASDRIKCTQAGMSDYLAKPFNRGQLIEILSRWLPHDNKDYKQLPSHINKQQNITTNNAEKNSLNFEILHNMKKILGNAFNELIPAYLGQSDSIISDMENAHDKNDIKTLERYAHSMKSSSYNVGAEDLSNEASILEALCQQNTENIQIKSKIDSIIKKYKHVKQKLLEYQEREDPNVESS